MIFMVLWNVDIPLLALKFIQGLKMLALFEFIPYKEILIRLGLACETECPADIPDEERVGFQRLRSSDNWL